MFASELKKRADKGETPYNLRNCAYMDDFFSEKITWGNLNLEASYCLAEEGMFINAPCAMIVPANKYLLAVLNSKLADYYIRGLGVTRNGGYFEYKPMFIERLPVPILSPEKELVFENLVNEILLSKSKNISCKELEHRINERVYELYDLQEPEIQLIDYQ
jgi:adenine-specific DNA-methyltransferase